VVPAHRGYCRMHTIVREQTECLPMSLHPACCPTSLLASWAKTRYEMVGSLAGRGTSRKTVDRQSGCSVRTELKKPDMTSHFSLEHREIRPAVGVRR
jgi:hypothetical protein